MENGEFRIIARLQGNVFHAADAVAARQSKRYTDPGFEYQSG